MNLIEIINVSDNLVKVKTSLWNSTELGSMKTLLSQKFRGIYSNSPRSVIRNKTKEAVKELK